MSLSEERKDFLKKDYVRGFPGHLGYEIVSMEYAALETCIKIRPEHRQQDGFVHAGVLATMADHTAGYSAFTTIPEDHRILTIEFKINFFKPAVGPVIVCRSKLVSQGRQIIIGESELFNQNGSEEKLIAKALVTLMSVPSSMISAPSI